MKWIANTILHSIVTALKRFEKNYNIIMLGYIDCPIICAFLIECKSSLHYLS